MHGGRRRGRARRGVAVVVSAAAIAAAPPFAAAEDAPLGEITVRAERDVAPQAPEDPTVFATVVDTAEKTAEADTVAEVLSETVGVHVRRFGGIGALSTVSIRGSAAGQVQVYLDGVAMSRARNEAVDLGSLPLDAVERIEVYRGFVPIGFSRAGPGGVINLVTRRPGAAPRTTVSATYGSFDTRKVDVERAARRGPWEYLVFGTYDGSEGDFTFRDDNGTPANRFDDETTTRRNGHFNAVDVVAKGGYRPSPETTLTLTNQAFFKDQGVPGISSNQAQEASLDEVRNLTHLRAELEGVGVPALDVRGTTHVLYDRARFSDPDGEIGLANQDRDDDTLATGFDALFTYYWGDHQVPSVLLASGYEQFHPDDHIDPAAAGPDQTRRLVGVAAQDEIYLFGGRLTVVPAVRWEWLDDQFRGDLPSASAGAPAPRDRTDTYTSPRLGVSLETFPHVTVLGNVGRSFRPPNFTELFGDRGVVIGNAELDAEDALNWDLGARLQRRGPSIIDTLFVEYAYFDSGIDDLVVLVPTSQRTLRPENVSEATVRGHEVSLSITGWRHVTLTANYTHQDALDGSPEPSRNGARLPGRPQDEGYVRAEVFGDVGRAFYEASFIGDNFRAPGERDRIGSRTIHNVGVSMIPARTGLTLTFEVKNIGDDRVSDFEGFPLPGRSFFGTVRHRF
jgi:iron complex outermembrane receptor protein